MVIGVSADPVKKQDAFKAKHQLAMPLASDEAHDMLEAYGVWGEKSMYGRTYMGIQRTTVLIDAHGRISRVWPKVKVEGHAEEVLAAAEGFVIARSPAGSGCHPRTESPRGPGKIVPCSVSRN